MTWFTFVKVIETWLITDFISGLVHWLEDSYGHPHTLVIGRYVTTPDLLHHFDPRRIAENSWFASSDVLLLVCTAALFFAAALGHLSPMVVISAALGANANQVHKWCHRTPRENGRLITAMQRLRLVQSPAHHRGHHSDGKDSCYCVLTDLLNPVLDRVGFWRGLERLVFAVFGATKRDDDALIALLLAEDPAFLDGGAAR